MALYRWETRIGWIWNATTYVTQAEYDALPSTKLTNNVNYWIYEWDGTDNTLEMFVKNWVSYCIPQWWTKIWCVDLLLVWWWGKWWGTWWVNGNYASWWWWGWGWVYCKNVLLYSDGWYVYPVIVWCSNSWDSIALWYCAQWWWCWWNWYCISPWRWWNAWWAGLCWATISASHQWWGGNWCLYWWWGWGAWEDWQIWNYGSSWTWWYWWCGVQTDFFWSNMYVSAWWGWWNLWCGWAQWWWDGSATWWWDSRMWCPATTYWSWWGAIWWWDWYWACIWWDWCQWIVGIRYKTNWSWWIKPSSTWWCKYEYWEYTIHCFTVNDNFSVVFK